MTTTDAVLDLAEDVTDILALLTSEVFVGLLVAFGLVIWVFAGKRDGSGAPAEDHRDSEPATPAPWRRY